ncbi:L-aspartate oxidase [Agromyces archimandritae]|uniref:L-aspartate oxidase n=1 Tax=Agromyces archimandritae TaxID=2781962 RepID=A0A975IN50_9MICO|nr:L-aspartate oxidase [Agromyces archimandritae]QTX04238.1 L-aspartate oxidase [Agromyces archimandritae]
MPIEVLVVGSGLAGLLTAIRAADAGCRVTLATKARLEDGSTASAQGGIAAAVFGGDSVERHVLDTLAAGAGHADADAVRVLCGEGPAAVRELIRHGVAFDHDDSGLARGLEAAHTRARILHADGDGTGRVIHAALLRAIAHRPVALHEELALVDLVVEEGRAVGADFLADSGRLARFTADAVVVATGGWGVLYGRTTNPSVATGDGVAAASRAGARISDVEFTQFHPTALAAPGAPLVSEAVRGEGAVLVDAAGRRFLPDVDPRAELAPRDVVARAVHAAMAAQGGEPVRLDATGLGAAFLSRRFPTVDRLCREAGFDWAREPVPVTPAAHYAMGGIATDTDGRSSLPGLYAVGEAACTGVHGANRLASNSLLEAAVFAGRAAEAILADAAPAARTDAGWRRRDAAPDAAVSAADADPVDRGGLQELMWRHAGLVRDAAGLGHARELLAGLHAPRPDTRAGIEDRNLLELARLVVDAALTRTASLGAHHRSDDDGSAHAASTAAGFPASTARRASTTTPAPEEAA